MTRKRSTRVLDAPRPRYEPMSTGVDNRPFLVNPRTAFLLKHRAAAARQACRLRPLRHVRATVGGRVAGRSYFRSRG
jgi:hypothetical protein